ncbi:MAG: helix-turn-helix domain-containing protein [Rhodothalassiaceae bacterium]
MASAVDRALAIVPAVEPPGEGAFGRVTQLFRSLDRLARETADETCNLSSRPLLSGSTEWILRSVMDARTVGAAAQALAQSYNLLHGGHYNHVHRRGPALSFTVDDRTFPYALPAGSDAAGQRALADLAIEGGLIFVHGVLRRGAAATGQTLRPMRLATRRRAPEGHGEPLLVVGAPVRWGAPMFRLSYAAGAELPFNGRSDALRAIPSLYALVLDDLAAVSAAPAGLAARVTTLIDQGSRDQRQVARRLGVSVATLRRRLAAEGCSFRTLLAERLNARARDLLASGRPAADVAEALGFSDRRSFTRAFKAWNGRTVAQYRQQRQP